MSQTLSPTEREQLEMALSFGMNPETSEPLTPEERATIEQILGEPGGPSEQALPLDEATAADPTSPEALAAQVAQIQQTLNALTTGGQAAPSGQQMTFEDVLNAIDPRDSDAALAMFQWLVDNKRLSRVGTLDGGGYLLHYSEPKGTTKAGYTPGKTQGGRMVDAAVERAKDAGAKPVDRGMCPKCYSVVTKAADGAIVLDDGTDDPKCSSGGTHDFHPA